MAWEAEATEQGVWHGRFQVRVPLAMRAHSMIRSFVCMRRSQSEKTRSASRHDSSTGEDKAGRAAGRLEVKKQGTRRRWGSGANSKGRLEVRGSASVTLMD